MPLDPQARAVLDQIPVLTDEVVLALAPPLLRQAMAAMPGSTGPVEAVARVENRTLPGPAGEIPVRVYAPERAARPARARLLPRRRLRDRQPRHARRHLPQPRERDRLRRGVGRLPARARAQVPGRARGLLRGDALGGREGRRARRRPLAHRGRRRQRGRQPHGRGRADGARPRRPRAAPPAADLPGREPRFRQPPRTTRTRRATCSRAR